MKVTAFVPIKLNSERLQNKNILDLGGKPLVSYIFEKLSRSNIDRLIVYCSDEKIMDYVPKDVEFLRRDPSLDRNITKGGEIYKSFIKKVKSEYYLLAHATSPFISSKSINLGLSKVLDTSNNFDSSTTVRKEQNFAWFKGKPINYSPDDVPRTQDLEPILIETSAFFLFSRETFIKTGRRIGDNPYLVQLKGKESIDIDTREDYELAKLYLKNE